MSWSHVEDDGTHSTWRCKICHRLGVSGSPTVKPSPCVCVPISQPKRKAKR